MRKLEEIRAEIDEVDAQMAQLFERRLGLSREAAALKAEAGLPTVDAGREAQIIETNSRLVSSENRERYAEFQKHVLEISKK
ncbi:MAG: chorismate mutase [Bacteroidales bacterium]|nr:chorismate mutase [Bacteroidales bacterium]